MNGGICATNILIIKAFFGKMKYRRVMRYEQIAGKRKNITDIKDDSE